MLVVMAVVVEGVLMMMVTMMGDINDVTCKFIAIAYGLSNDGYNGSSSENKCNGELDLSHFK